MSTEHRLTLSSSHAYRFVVIIGVANLFADMTYEGARSITGPFLQMLGASAAVVGFTAGFGELVGYALRSVAGFIGDRTGRYWLMAIMGYAINMLAVPALALSGSWPVAAGLIVGERTGRAIRKPITEAMLSFAAKQVGPGRTFGMVEFLDQLGATAGPLIVAFVLFRQYSYQASFAVLLAPAILTVVTLLIARMDYPDPRSLEPARSIAVERFSKPYWLYMAAAGCVAAGFADFALIAYHFEKTRSVAPDVIPVFYAVAMAIGGICALAFGSLFDRVGVAVVIVAFLLSSFFAPLVFLTSGWGALLGMVLWGIGMGAQESVLKSLIVGIIPSERRSTAFGVFDTGFGIAWFLGSWLMGVLYDVSLTGLIVFSVLCQLASLPLFLLSGRRRQRQPA
jgi:predicted MFS family arabinose efflux permease